MTPKEKAKELVDKFRNEFIWVEKDHSVDLYRDTKQCALIAVDIVIQQEAERCLAYRETDKFVDYWQEVKQEIEKL
jgi:hypothetical protein